MPSRTDIVAPSELNIDDVFPKIPIIPKVKRKRGSKPYLDIITAFDIEATRLKDIEQAVMYVWQWQIGPDITVVGRTWEEFFRLLEEISLRLSGIAWLVIYVHNLSYEFQFLKGRYSFRKEEVFANDKRKVLKCEMMDCFEFRCSYQLTNMSLDAYLKKMNVPNKKLTYDYSKIRYPWTELSDPELDYCINDVRGLVQALQIQMRADGDTVQTVPLTSTGYPRRDSKQAMRQYNYMQLHDMLPGVKVYKLLREAFRGGDTLSNRWRTDEVIENIRSVDIVSSYPFQMLTKKYPMTPFIQEDPRRFETLYEMENRALIFRVRFVNIRPKHLAEGHLYLSRDKCRDIQRATFVNGRILQAQHLETTITDIDFDIINRRYEWDRMYISDLYSSRYRMLPSMLRNVIREYYRIKTELKGTDPESEDYIYYTNSKARLNSVYGMTVEDPAKDSIDFIDGDFIQRDDPLRKLLAAHNHSAFLAYQWGVWVTCHARAQLAAGIDVVTKNGEEPMNFIYSDTDSIKFVGDADFSDFNAEREEEAISKGAYAADRNGEIHPLGLFEDEGYPARNRFKTLGAKKYVIEYPDGSLHITIAGVNKKKGAEELGKIENFREGFIFRKAGGTEAVFNDHIDKVIHVDGHDLRITDNMVIRDSTYTLGITAEYREILDGLVTIKYSDQDIPGLYKVKT